jgi:hypothetical protein
LVLLSSFNETRVRLVAAWLLVVEYEPKSSNPKKAPLLRSGQRRSAVDGERQKTNISITLMVAPSAAAKAAP